jgi:hypothetical protein
VKNCPACNKPIRILKIRDKFSCEKCAKPLKSNSNTIFGWWVVIWFFGIGTFITPALFQDVFWYGVIFDLVAGFSLGAMLFSMGIKITEDLND